MTRKTQIENWLRNFIIGAGALATLTPLIDTNKISFGEIFVGAIVFQMIVELMLVAWIALALSNRKYRPNFRNPIFIGVAVYILMLLVHLFFSIDPWQSFWSDRMRITGVASYLHFGAYFLVLFSTLKSWKEWRVIVYTTLSVCLIVCLVGFGQTRITTRITSTIGNPVYLGSYLVVHCFLALFIFAKEKARAVKIFSVILFLLSSLAIVLTGSRGATLALLIGILVFGALSIFHFSISKRNKTLVFSIFLFLITLSAGVTVYLRSSVDSQAVREYLPAAAVRLIYADLGSDRLTIWSKAIEGYKDRPIYGWGLENFGYVFDRTYDPGGEDTALVEMWYAKPHSLYFEILTATGTIGALAFLFMWGSVFFVLFRSYRQSENKSQKLALAAMASLFISHLVQAAFCFDMPPTLIIVFSMMALTAMYDKTAKDTESEKTNVPEIQPAWLVAAIFFVLFIPVQYYVNYLPLRQSYINQKSYLVFYGHSGESYEQGFAYMKEALDPHTMVTRGLRQRSVDILRPLVDQFDFSNSLVQEMSFYLASELDESARDQSTNFKTQYIATLTFRIAAGFDDSYYDRAVELAQSTVDNAPYRGDGYEELGQLAVMRGDFDKAHEYYDFSIEHSQKIRLANLYYLKAIAYANEKRIDKAYEYLQLAQEAGFPGGNDIRLILVIMENLEGDEYLDETLKYYEALTPRFSQHAEFLQRGVYLYFRDGNTPTASYLLSLLNHIDPQTAKQLIADLEASEPELYGDAT